MRPVCQTQAEQGNLLCYYASIKAGDVFTEMEAHFILFAYGNGNAVCISNMRNMHIRYFQYVFHMDIINGI
jgi:hypothetical protein